MQGRVRWFNKHFGYGFITGEDGEDIFVHYSVIDTGIPGQKSLRENEVVNYSVKHDNMRLKATNVTRLKKGQNV